MSLYIDLNMMRSSMSALNPELSLQLLELLELLFFVCPVKIFHSHTYGSLSMLVNSVFWNRDEIAD